MRRETDSALRCAKDFRQSVGTGVLDGPFCLGAGHLIRAKKKSRVAALFCSAPKAQPDPSRRCHVPALPRAADSDADCAESLAAVFPYGNKDFRAKKKSRVAALFCSAPKAQPVPARLTLRCPALPRAADSDADCAENLAAVFPYGNKGFRAKKKSRKRLFFALRRRHSP